MVYYCKKMRSWDKSLGWEMWDWTSLTFRIIREFVRVTLFLVYSIIFQTVKKYFYKFWLQVGQMLDECHPDWTHTLHVQKSVAGYSDQQKKTNLSQYLSTKEKEQRNAPPKRKYRKKSVRHFIYFKVWTYPTTNKDLYMFRIIKLIMWLGHCLLKWMLMVEKRIWTKKKLYVLLHLTIIKLASI